MKKRIISTAIAAILAVSALSTSAFAVTQFDQSSPEYVIPEYYTENDLNTTAGLSNNFDKNAEDKYEAGAYQIKTLSNGVIVKGDELAEAAETLPAITLPQIYAAIQEYEGITTALNATSAAKTAISKNAVGSASEGNVVFTGTLVSPVIKVTVPTDEAKYVLNPYGLTVEFKDNSEYEDGYTDAQIISQKLKFRNHSECAIGVGVKLSSTPAASSTAKVATAPIAADDTSKSIFIYAVGGEAVDDEDNLNVAKTAYDENAENILAQAKSAQKNFKTLLTLDAYDADEETNIWGAIDLQGELNTHLKAGTEWETADTLTVNLVYQFSQVKL